MTKQEEKSINEYCDWVIQQLPEGGPIKECKEEDISNWLDQDLPEWDVSPAN